MLDQWASETGLSRDQLADALQSVLATSRFSAERDVRFASDCRVPWFNQGWDCDAFATVDADGQRWLIKLAKRAEVEPWIKREAGILRDFAELGFDAAPRLGFSGTLEGGWTAPLAFIGISEIKGHRLFEALELIAAGEAPLDLDRCAQSYGKLIRRMHGLRPASLKPVESPQPFPLKFHVEHARSVLPLADQVLGAGYGARLQVAFDTLVAVELPSVEQVFCHADLYPEHIFMREGSSEVYALIDWADARYRDPAADFAVTAMDLGEPFLQTALAAYTDDPAERGAIAARARVLAALTACFDPADAARDAPNVPGARRVPRTREMIDAGWLRWDA